MEISCAMSVRQMTPRTALEPRLMSTKIEKHGQNLAVKQQTIRQCSVFRN